MISVIVPIYNGKHTIEKCVNSLLLYDSNILEIILVDDGSTDDSWSVIEQYSLHYNNVIGIRQKNKGLSDARNAGILCAHGEYITFVDSDDYLEPGIYQECITIINQLKPDIIHFNYYIDTKDGVWSAPLNKLKRNTLLDRGYIEQYVIPSLINVDDKADYFCQNFVWNKIYKKRIIDEYAIRFEESRRMWEDRLYLVHFSKHMNSMYSIPTCGYHYVIRETSLSHRFDKDILKIVMENYRQYVELFGEKYDLKQEYSVNYYTKLLNNCVFNALDSSAGDLETIKLMLEDLIEDEEAVELYSLYVEKTSFDKKIGKAIRTKSVDMLLTAYKGEHRKRKKVEKIVYLKKTIFRVIGYIKRCFLTKVETTG